MLDENEKYTTHVHCCLHACKTTCNSDNYIHVHVQVLLHVHCRYNQLTWHDGAIPADEIWIKVGGDKGGTVSTLKMSFQICNVTSPNAVSNTSVFCVFQASDTPVNLEIGLERFREHITHLQQMTWRYIHVLQYIACVCSSKACIN